MNKTTTLVDVIKLIYKHRKKILIATAIVTIVTIIISLLMPNYYRATTTFYAASPDLAMPDPIGLNIEKKEFYGNKTDIDRILTIANSGIIKDYLIDKFNLYTHYDIDSTKELSKFTIRKKLSKLYSIKKNEKDAIELSVEDIDKDLATKMANTARRKIEKEINNLIKTTQKLQITELSRKINDNTHELNQLVDTIKYLQEKYSVIDIKSQGKELASQLTKSKSNLVFLNAKLNLLEKSRYSRRDSVSLIKANIAGNQSKIKELDSLVKSFNAGAQSILILIQEKNNFSEQLALEKEKLNQLKSIYNSDFTVLHLVEKADVPLRKFRPKRSIYVIGAFLLTLFFSILIVLILEENKKINWKD